MIIPRDTDAGSAVLPYLQGDESGESAQGNAGETDAGAQDAGLLLACEADSDCLDNNVCNGIERCESGFCRAGKSIRCDDGSPCTRDTCDPATALCVFSAIANGVPCSAVDKCDGYVCLEGVCTPGIPVVCGDDGNVCTQDVCDPTSGMCVTAPLADGTSCDDANACNGGASCHRGVCQQAARPSCDDANACTIDSCDAVLGCSHTPLADGTSCDDGNLCNGPEICRGGVCQAGTAATCNDGKPCTTDTCDPATGACRFTPLANGSPCPDGNVCDGQVCQDSQCVAASPVVCARENDNNPCTTTVCNPTTGQCQLVSEPNGTPCPDGDQCDGIETCQNGACTGVGTPLVCSDDGNPCTDAVCVPLAGCVHASKPNGSTCADNNACDGVETCQSGLCADTGIPVACDDHNPCTIDVCSPGTGGCVSTALPDATSCSDNNSCNGTETCQSGLCVTGTPLVCNDNNPCTIESCNPANGSCVVTNAADGTTCADANLCDGLEVCGNGVCLAGAPIVCNDSNACTTDSCNPATGGCSHAALVDGTSCADSNLCNGAEVCSSGFCVTGQPVSCVVPTTCNPATGICSP